MHDQLVHEVRALLEQARELSSADWVPAGCRPAADLGPLPTVREPPARPAAPPTSQKSTESQPALELALRAALSRERALRAEVLELRGTVEAQTRGLQRAVDGCRGLGAEARRGRLAHEELGRLRARLAHSEAAGAALRSGAARVRQQVQAALEATVVRDARISTLEAQNAALRKALGLPGREGVNV